MLLLLIVFLAICVILEVISLKRNPAKVSFSLELSAAVTEPDEQFEVRTIITNESIIPVSYLKISENYPHTANLPDGIQRGKGAGGQLYISNICRTGGRQKKKRSLKITISKRGSHMFRGGFMEFGDFLGIREFYKDVYFSREILVYPKKIDRPDITDALGSFCGDIAAERFLIRDPIITIGSREYSGREPMREIHWLMSAKRGELMVREFDYTRELSAAVVFAVDDIGIDEQDLMDECCSAARSVCETLAGLGVYISFYSNGYMTGRAENGVWKHKASAGNMKGLLEGLSRIASYNKCSVNNLLSFAATDGSTENAFIVILPAANAKTDSAVDELRRRTGRSTLTIHVNSSNDKAEDMTA